MKLIRRFRVVGQNLFYLPRRRGSWHTKKEQDHIPPEARDNVELLMRIEIIERLLRDGQVDTWALARELQQSLPNYRADWYEHACRIIDNYITADGAGLHGGTGLPPAP
jgi:hypothetical protein